MDLLPTKSLILIQKYFKDELTVQEKIEFNDKLSNLSFREEIFKQTNAFEATIALRRDKIRLHLENAHQQLTEEKIIGNSIKSQKNRGSQLFILLGLLAFIIVVIGISYFSNQRIDNEQLFAQYYSPYSTSEGQRSTANIEAKETLFSDVYNLYEDEQYQKTIELLYSMSAELEALDIVKAHSLLNLDSINESKAIFQKLTTSSDKEIRQRSEWYLALNYLLLKDNASTVRLLDSIRSNPDHLYNGPASSLFEDMK